jgi:hypothetical protein
MSLTSRKVIPVAMGLCAVVALASCSQQSTPTAPSSAIAVTGSPVAEYYVTLADPSGGTSSSRDVSPGSNAETIPEPVYAPGSATTPWPPGPPPQAAPGVPMPTPPSTDSRFLLKIEPEPVAHSGVPIPLPGCQDLKYTWYYDQVLHNQSGIPVTFTERENFFDARFVSVSRETIELAGNGTVILHTRWCSGHPKPHYTQSRFKGKNRDGEAVTISGPWVRLLTP